MWRWAPDDPIAAILPLVEAYCAENPLGEIEADALFDLILTRYAVSMVMAARQHRQKPENDYLLISQDDVGRGTHGIAGAEPPADNRASARRRRP